MTDGIDGTLLGVVQRVTRVETLLEEHGKASQEFRTSTSEHMARLESKVSGIDTKLDGIAAEITLAKTAVRSGAGVIGWVAKQVPAVSIGGAATWLANHFWSAR